MVLESDQINIDVDMLIAGITIKKGRYSVEARITLHNGLVYTDTALIDTQLTSGDQVNDEIEALVSRLRNRIKDMEIYHLVRIGKIEPPIPDIEVGSVRNPNNDIASER